MGERHSNGGAPDRRVARPGDARPGDARPGEAHSCAEAFGEVRSLEPLLAAALRAGALDVDGEARAVAAFRAARDQGAYAAHAARTRRRDDWRPRQPKAKRSLRTTFAVLAASVTLGGVAVAAIGSSSDGNGNGDGQGRPRPSSSAPDRSAPGAGNSAAPGTSAPGASGTTGSADPSAHPSQAQDTEAHCRAYEAVEGRGKALDSTSWQRLVDAAGGEDQVAAYCAAQLDEDTPSAGRTDATENSAGGNGNGTAGTPGAASTARATPATTPKPKPDRSKGKS
ncbi:hypothetical protein AB5J56_17675 [Streptomyces sp. R21]|uniref:Uncharacterized protein n=1 Tax=Streptomyces sp. R21 TaxID=3238627 RepID=A0AB39P8K1_9ACTN